MDGFRRRALHNFRRAIGKEQVSIKEIADGYNKHILPSLRNVSPIPKRATEFERVGYVPTSMLDEYMEESFIQFFTRAPDDASVGGYLEWMSLE